MGNEKSNGYWEAELPPRNDRVGIENFIRAKYVEKRWIPRDGKFKSSPGMREERISENKLGPGTRSAGYILKSKFCIQPSLVLPFPVQQQNTMLAEQASIHIAAAPRAWIPSQSIPNNIHQTTSNAQNWGRTSYQAPRRLVQQMGSAQPLNHCSVASASPT
ncbi:hypothetical protein ACH5RR_015026 [Cinchona calisaya]|uniref:Uncharacterized protein n=1 Tax=Cinchona calisaya TaxID=153742 RepID=A0ABD2ZRY6_9GENT